MSYCLRRWRCLHWLTRLSAVVALAAVLRWQVRYSPFFSLAQFGWPLTFKHLDVLQGGDSPLFFVIDLIIWLALAASTAYVVNHWRHQQPALRQAAAHLSAYRPLSLSQPCWRTQKRICGRTPDTRQTESYILLSALVA